MTRRQSVMAFAASAGKIGFVFLRGDELLDWELSAKASWTVEGAYAQSKAWLEYYRPDIVLLEEIDGGSRKSAHSQTLIQATEGAAAALSIPWERVVRRRRYPNKYVEAAALAEEFPMIRPWLPRFRRKWQPEPRRIIYFEALAMARDWLKSRPM